MRKLKNSELKRVSVEECKRIKKFPVVIVLDNIRSAYNVGSVFRTADAFLVKKIFLCGITAFPPNREINKTALGAVDSVEWKYFKTTLEAIKFLQKNDYKIIGIEQSDKSKMLNKFIPKKSEKYALIFGNEVGGISEEVFSEIDECIEIPQSGTKHSLNVAVSVGVVLWEFYSKLGK